MVCESMRTLMLPSWDMVHGEFMGLGRNSIENATFRSGVQELSILELPDWFTLGSISIAFWFSVIPTIIFSVEFSVNNPNQQELIVELGEILISKK